MSLVIYGRTLPFCPFCEQAKSMATKAKLDFIYKDLSKNEWDIDSLEKQLNIKIRTVPVVTVDNVFIGGAAELSKYIRGV